MIKFLNVNAGYETKKIVLKNFTWETPEKGFVGIIGPNGAGKSTIFRLLIKYILPLTGEIYLNNMDIKKYTQENLAKIIALLPQKPIWEPSLSVEEYISLGRYPHHPSWRPLSKKDIIRVNEIMILTDTIMLKKKKLHQLSGGELQRVIIARILAQDPQIILLDEPTNNLDPYYQISLLDKLRELSKEILIIANLHDINLASFYTDYVLALKNGIALSFGKTKEVLNCNLLNHLFNIRYTEINYKNKRIFLPFHLTNQEEKS